MKTINTILIAVCILTTYSLTAQVSVTTDGTSADGSAMLEVKSTEKGFLPPRMTKTQRDEIESPATGLIIYQTDNTPGLYQYNGSAWTALIELDPTPATNTVSGITSSVTIDANTLGFAAALFIASDGNYEMANATDITTMPCVALAVESGTGTKKILHQGYVQNENWNWTVGGIIYASTTNGVLSQEFPTGSANQVQIVGYATAADKMFFSPNFMLIELK